MTATALKELAEAKEVCPTTTRRLLAEGALLVDVREPAEVAKVGYADCDVVNIPLSQLEDRFNEIPRDRDVVLACAVGERSLKATYFLMYQGYDRVSNMNPGIGRWIARGFPVTGDVSAATNTAAVSACGCGDDAQTATSICCGGDGATTAKDGVCSSDGACC